MPPTLPSPTRHPSTLPRLLLLHFSSVVELATVGTREESDSRTWHIPIDRKSARRTAAPTVTSPSPSPVTQALASHHREERRFCCLLPEERIVAPSTGEGQEEHVATCYGLGGARRHLLRLGQRRQTAAPSSSSSASSTSSSSPWIYRGRWTWSSRCQESG